MNFDYQAKKPEDMTKINSNDLDELLWWSYILGTCPEKIMAIVEDFGSSVESIRKNIR